MSEKSNNSHEHSGSGSGDGPDLLGASQQAQCEAISFGLAQEFRTHFAEMIKLNPEYADSRPEIFESWIIQKIASMQAAILDLAQRLGDNIIGMDVSPDSQKQD